MKSAARGGYGVCGTSARAFSILLLSMRKMSCSSIFSVKIAHIVPRADIKIIPNLQQTRYTGVKTFGPTYMLNAVALGNW
jgi:hypothetical protein